VEICAAENRLLSCNFGGDPRPVKRLVSITCIRLIKYGNQDCNPKLFRLLQEHHGWETPSRLCPSTYDRSLVLSWYAVFTAARVGGHWVNNNIN